MAKPYKNLRDILESNYADIKHARKKADATAQKIDDEVKKIEKLISTLADSVDMIRSLSYDEDDAIQYKMMGNTLEDCTRMKQGLDKTKMHLTRARKDISRTKWK